MKLGVSDLYIFAAEFGFGLAALMLFLAGVISADIGIAAILFSFAPALFPAILENHRKKMGWNRHSTLLTFWGEAVIGVIFYTLNMNMSTAITVFLTVVWGILFYQSVIYYQSDGDV